MARQKQGDKVQGYCIITHGSLLAVEEVRCGHILDPPRQQSQRNLLKAQCRMWSNVENGSKVLGLNTGEEGASLPGTGKTAEGGVREGGSP